MSKRKRRHQPEEEGSPDPKRRREKEELGEELAAYASEGALSKLKRLVKGHRKDCKGLLEYADAQGRTALHHASRGGHLDTVKWLLKHDADVKRLDRAWNTPGHAAAANGHLAVVHVLLQAKDPGSVDSPNAQGFTVEQLVAAALAQQGVESGESSDGGEEDFVGPTPAAEGEEEAGDGTTPRGFFRSPGGVWGEDGGCAENGPRFDGYDDFSEGGLGFGGHAAFGPRQGGGDDYVDHLREELDRKERERRRAGPSAFTQAAWEAAERARQHAFEHSAAGRRAKAAEEAKERSRKILDEEQEKDRLRRARLLEKKPLEERLGYETRWERFAASPSTSLRAKDVPWLPADPDVLRLLLFSGLREAKERKDRINAELMRWHPDKFGKHRGKFVEGEWEGVLEQVKGVSQRLNQMKDSV